METDAKPKININFELIPETFSTAPYLPKKPKEGYVCHPSFDVLEKMTR